MKGKSLAVAAGLVIAGSGALAQVPADPNNPNENLPEKHAYRQYGDPIKLEQARRALDAALAESAKRGWAMCIAVVGPSGDLVSFAKMDDCQYGSIQVALHKARTAARFRVPTVVFERRLAQGHFNTYLLTLDDVSAVRGGNPIVVDGKVIGAIGVSGASGTQDDVVSQAGVAAVK